MISESALEKFKKLYFQRFSKELDDAEALDRANYLLNVGLAVYGHPLRGRKEEAEAELLTNQNNYHDNKFESETQTR